jgi:serine/threonine-protein kinase HipA
LLAVLATIHLESRSQRAARGAMSTIWSDHEQNLQASALAGRGRYALTPLYDVLTAQPSLDARRIERKQMKLAMSVGDNRHYRIDEVLPRHFFRTSEQAGLSKSLIRTTLEDIATGMDAAIAALEAALPADFPRKLHESVTKGIRARMRVLESGLRT